MPPWMLRWATFDRSSRVRAFTSATVMRQPSPRAGEPYAYLSQRVHFCACPLAEAKG